VWRRADKKVFKKEKNNQDDNNKKIKPESKRSRKVPEDFRKAVKALDIFED
jgi:hypothetical protein